MELTGKEIGSYRLLEKIAHGGMGILYKGVHKKLEQFVAVKVLAPHLAKDMDMAARFFREAKLQAKLSHPNVVNILDYLEDEENIYLVMEFVTGQTLENILLSRGRLSPEETLHIAEGVLKALVFMHNEGIVHRDIKPANIMLLNTGLVKVTDFGVARFVKQGQTITRVGARVGTIHYMAPELLTSGEISYSIDIYSLGVTLYQLLSGDVPFTGETDYEIIRAHLDKRPEPLRNFNEKIPANVEEMVRKAMGKKPSKRYKTAVEFLEDVVNLRSMTEIITVKPSAEENNHQDLRKKLSTIKLATVNLSLSPTPAKSNKYKYFAAAGATVLLLFILAFTLHNPFSMGPESSKNAQVSAGQENNPIWAQTLPLGYAPEKVDQPYWNYLLHNDVLALRDKEQEEGLMQTGEYSLLQPDWLASLTDGGHGVGLLPEENAAVSAAEDKQSEEVEQKDKGAKKSRASSAKRKAVSGEDRAQRINRADESKTAAKNSLNREPEKELDDQESKGWRIRK